MPYDDILKNWHMISLQCKMFEDNFKASNFENTELKKSNEDMKKKIQTIKRVWAWLVRLMKLPLLKN